MKEKEKPLKIYRNGQLDYAATYTPVAKKKVHQLAGKIDFWFVNNRWPRDGEA
jgi:hypothetical protein